MDQLVVVVAVVVVVVFVTFSTKRRGLLHHTIKDDLRLVIGACQLRFNCDKYVLSKMRSFQSHYQRSYIRFE